TEHAYPAVGFCRSRQYGRGGSVHIPLQVQDDKLGRQRFSTEPGWTIILTAPTTRTRIQVEELLPGKIRQLPNAKTHARHRLFIAFQGFVEVSDRRELTLGAGLMQQDIQRRKDHMAELRVANVRQQTKGHQHMGPPPETMPPEKLALRHCQTV